MKDPILNNLYADTGKDGKLTKRLPYKKRMN